MATNVVLIPHSSSVIKFIDKQKQKLWGMNNRKKNKSYQ